jgi:hypothetical protein
MHKPFRALAAAAWLLASTSTAAPPLVTFSKTGGWDTGYNGSIVITNRGRAASSRPWSW